MVFGALTLYLMSARIQLAEGGFIDARSVPIALVTLFEGWVAGLIAVAPALAYRGWLGGSGATAGVAGLVAVVVVAGLCHVWARRDGGVFWRHSFALGAAVFMTTLGSFALLGERGLDQFATMWLPYVGLYAIGIGVIARLFRDVGDRARLQAERERFHAVIDSASDAIRIVDPETLRILDTNRADCELSGYSREAMIGRDIREFWPDDPAHRAEREARWTARTDDLARHFGLPYRTRSGKIVTVDTTRRTVEHAGRRYDVVVFREAAEREAAEAARREASELRAINLVAMAAAHEINNPLTVVMGALDLIARHMPPDSKDGSLVQQAIAGGGRIKDIVKRMTRITRVETETTTTLPPILDIRKSSDLEER